MKKGQTIGKWLKWDFEANGDLKIQDINNMTIYAENSHGFWCKTEIGKFGGIYFEDSNGVIVDGRTAEIIEYKGHKYKLIP